MAPTLRQVTGGRQPGEAEGGRKAERDAERAAKFAAKGPEGAPKVDKAPGRRTNVGRKAEATDQFRPPRCGFVCHEPLRAGPLQRFELLPNRARRRLAEYRRWTNGGRKVEPTDQFWPPHWRSIGYEHCNDETVVAVISPDRGRTLAPSACRRGCN